MKPSALILSLLLGIAGTAGVGYGGFRLGVDHARAAEADRNDLIAQAVDQAAQKSAEAIRQIKITHTTLRQEVQREIRHQPVYMDCRHTPDGMRLLEAVLSGQPVAAGNGQLPTPDTTQR